MDSRGIFPFLSKLTNLLISGQKSAFKSEYFFSVSAGYQKDNSKAYQLKSELVLNIKTYVTLVRPFAANLKVNCGEITIVHTAK